ncbi:MAG: N-acetylmuramoyl-L-alanine amidase [Ginsengibacter sp.]
MKRMLHLKNYFFYPGRKMTFLLLSSFLITSFVFSQSPKRINTIIIDPGHGGSDRGAIGEYEGALGLKEKDVTLAISIKLVNLLKKQLPEVKIIPTRTTDIFMNVREKAAFANENHGDLFVCIHADAVDLKTGSRIIGYRAEKYTTHKYVGKGKKRKKIVTSHTREVPIKEYFKIPTSRKGTSTLILVARQAADKVKALEKSSDMQFDIAGNDSTLDIDYESPEWKASAMLYSQLYFKKSHQLATAVQEEIAKTGRNDLGVWQRQKGLWVLHATNMPAILIETGFLANPDDERYLASSKGQDEIAQAIADAIIKYRAQVEAPKNAAASAISQPK